MAAADAKKSAVVGNNSSTELGDVGLEIYQILGLFECYNIIEVNILVAPFKVVNNSFVSELLLDNEQVLEEFHDTLVDIKVVKFRDHCLLVLQILLVSVDECVSLVDDGPDVLKDLGIKILFQSLKCIINCLVFALLSLQFVVHRLDLVVVTFEFA